jgi:predicted ATP-dependent protease
MFFKRGKQDKSKPVEAPPEAPKEAGNKDAGSKSAATDDASPAPAFSKGAVAIDPETLGFKTTADLDPASEPVGQTRALEALAFGAGMKGPGYNILVVGHAGSGSEAAARAKINEVAGAKKRPPDWVYVRYFEDDGGFRALTFPAGKAKGFVEAMAQAIDRLADALPAAFASEDYELKRRTIEEEFRFSREDALEALRREAETQNIALLRTPAGIAVAPILDGKVVRNDVFNSVPEALRQEVKTKIAALEAEIEHILAERPAVEKSRRERLLALNEEIAGRQVRAVIDDLTATFKDIAGAERYLKAAVRDLVRNAGLFLALPGHESVKIPVGTISDTRFARYRVHAVVASEAEAKAPVVEEGNPTYANLFGRIEVGPGGEARQAQVVRIRPGALHRANGGFLIIDARALLSSPVVVEALARALDAQEIRFDPPADPVGVTSGEIPELEPIPLEIKIVLLADAETKRSLAKSAAGLMRHFKSEAVFDDAVERSSDIITAYARRIAGIVAENGLKPLEAKGVALLIDEAARKAGGNGKLSTEIGHIADVCREADHWAQNAGRNTTSAADVERALKERDGRANAQASAP